MTAYSSVVLAKNPEAYWPLSESPGAVQAADGTGHNHPLTYAAGVTLGLPSLNLDPITSFRPAATVATIRNDDDLLDIRTNSMSWEFWFAASQTSRIILYRKSDISNSNGCIINLTNPTVGQLDIAVGGPANPAGAPSVKSIKTTYNNGQPHHVVGVFDRIANTLSLYIDGILSNVVAAGSGYAGLDLNAGAALQVGSTGSNPILAPGSMQSFAIYRSALTPDQVMENYRYGIGGYEPLIGLNDQSGSLLTVVDQAGSLLAVQDQPGSIVTLVDHPV